MPYTVCILGLGYIGLPTAAFLANAGAEVIGVDIKKETVAAVNSGRVPFAEPGFDALLSGVVSSGRLRASLVPEPSSFYVIAVPTPFFEDHTIDMRHIYSAADSIASLLKPSDVVILESTSSPGTTERLEQRIRTLRPDLYSPKGKYTVGFAHAPERVIPGKIMEEMVSNDRIIGGTSPQAGQRAAELYKLFCHGEVMETNAVTAEMVKLAENSFRDVNIAFANELSLICEDLGIDVWELIRLANRHPRVSILAPGPGVGGHCIAVDPWFIVSSAGKKAQVIEAARNVNDGKPQFVVDKILKALAAEEVESAAVLGLTFKADVDDFRESPSVKIVEALAKMPDIKRLDVVEPNANVLPEQLRNYDSVRLVSLENAVSTNAVVVLLVDHKQFKVLPRDTLAGKRVLDFKGVWGDL